MAIIDNAYTYYLSTYGNRIGTRYDSHKKSELRKVYNQIVKLNKEAPLYKFKNSGTITKYAIDIKEGAQHIRNVVASISGSDDIMKALQKKSAVSSQEDIVTARYIGKDEEQMKDFDIEVRQLAKPQVNIGNFLKSIRRDLTPDAYSFDITNSSSSYEFQFNVSQTDTNYSIQKKLSNLITSAGIGLTASVMEDANGQSALRIESLQTGLSEDEKYLFNISVGGGATSAVALNILGIDQISQEAQNSSFLLNGVPQSSYSNTFSINNAFELTLRGISPEGQPATIGFKPDAQSVLENIQSLTNAFNSVIETSNTYAERYGQNRRLQYQIGSAADAYRDELAAIGLHKEEDGLFSVDASALTEIIESENPSEQLAVLNDFKQTLDTRAALAVLNPMEFVNKVIVTYKNPGRNFSAPYMTSLYSGMMMDHFC
ncbi:MAG: flagellar filament capping protein FliD [Lachnospiraceae bacterium]|nr:flagellar filament capping protein FliD [Lachnospiraceae bacterium]